MVILVVVLQSTFFYEVPQDCWRMFLSRSLGTLFQCWCLYQILTSLTSSVSGGLQTSYEGSYLGGCITNNNVNLNRYPNHLLSISCLIGSMICFISTTLLLIDRILVWLFESSFIVLSICSFCVVDSSSTFSLRSPMTY